MLMLRVAAGVAVSELCLICVPRPSAPPRFIQGIHGRGGVVQCGSPASACLLPAMAYGLSQGSVKQLVRIRVVD